MTIGLSQIEAVGKVRTLMHFAASFRFHSLSHTANLLSKNVAHAVPEPSVIDFNRLPEVTVFCGSVGSGKSTVIASYINYFGEASVPLVSVDLIYKTIENTSDFETRYRKGKQKAEELLRLLIARRLQFLWEVVAVKEDKFSLFTLLFDNGYYTKVFFMVTNDVAINLERVGKRTQEGEHHVPREKIYERFDESTSALPRVMSYASEVAILDNSDSLSLRYWRGGGYFYSRDMEFVDIDPSSASCKQLQNV